MSKFLILSLLYSFSLFASDPNLLREEFVLLDRLQEATRESLKNQEHLKKTLSAYKENLSLYLENSGDKDLALKVSRVAALLLAEIKENYLLEAFNTDFISELTLFAQLSEKKGIPRP